MIQARQLTKRYGEALAVDHLSFEVGPGRVTGFLGPNGAGKSTTLRLIVGLDAPSEGTVTVDGVAYGNRRRPLFEVGAMLEARSVHPGRNAYNHLLALAQSNGIARRRVDEVLDAVGLSAVAGQRVGSFSLGMGQRLGVGAALLGDPGVLLLDEPVNGLDPEGIIWIRNLLKSLAAEGRTIFVSSHLMSEMALTADHLVVIGRGRLIAESSMQDFVRRASGNYLRVRSAAHERLGALLRAEGALTRLEDDGALAITGAGAEDVGELALGARIAIYELSAQQASLEAAFMEMTTDSVDYRGSAAPAGMKPAAMELTEMEKVA
jgi:ABC-2 type transport system ATP-binding protein